MAHYQTARFTVIGTEPHMQAGESAERPVSVLFDDAVAGVAELRLTAAEAAELSRVLLLAAGNTMRRRA